jgi:hypothetical protein
VLSGAIATDSMRVVDHSLLQGAERLDIARVDALFPPSESTLAV